MFQAATDEPYVGARCGQGSRHAASDAGTAAGHEASDL